MKKLLKIYLEALKSPNKIVKVVLTQKEKQELSDMFDELF